MATATKGQAKAKPESGEIDITRTRTLSETDTAAVLLNTGLLFEINRSQLHPFGMQLNVVPHTDGVHTFELLVGVAAPYFDPTAFARGSIKFQRWLTSVGNKLLDMRRRSIGFTIQTMANVSHQKPR